ncbi:type II toxin-antitoxin system HipA family toxin [Mycobacteroides abscessus]|uniref:type II toxin-antitoxin system HipA family toxin n=1 Tax=Mycobacteroides abscessus TaxID=36809 RepID=UPI0009A60B11|nr:type II toxin-antitoxin system HipA family toxin [Mycobacteroides abscessus]SKK33908.1 HipA domain-containing protein [Mycobacteroides abscessus subsp. abscessus]
MSNQDLVVVLNGQVAGVITHEYSRPSFTYTDTYINADGTPLSLSMPRRPGHTFGHRTVAPWLAGLLPDDPRVRQHWAREYGVAPENSSALLEHIGRDCAGAVQIATVDTVSDVLSQTGHLEPASDKQIGQRLRQLHTQSDQWARAQDRWSLAGHQSKFTIARTPDGWAFTHGNAASTHIVKPGITRYDNQALNEHLCQSALAAVGLAAASTQYLEFDGTPAIVVSRYDRLHTGDDTIVRIHQEDMCQALSVWPHKKYASDGGPAAVTIAELLSKQATQQDVDRFTDAVIAQYLLGAPDAHAKNYSIILAGDDAALAPLYDVASSLPYDPDPRSTLSRVAMPIAGQSRFGDLSYHRIERFATNTGTDPDRLVATTRALAETLPDAITDAAQHIPPDIIGEFGTRLRDGVAGQCASLQQPGRRRPITDDTEEPDPPTSPDDPVDDDNHDVPVVGHNRSGHPITGHRRRRPTRSHSSDPANPMS